MGVGVVSSAGASHVAEAALFESQALRRASLPGYILFFMV